MTTAEKVASRKLSMVQLASELGNVSNACKVIGYSRQQFYEIRRNYQTYGSEGLIDRLPGARGPHPSSVSAEVETAASGGVRGVWQRHGLLTNHDRLLRLEKSTAELQITLSDEQVRLLERLSPEFRDRHIEAP